MLSFPTVSRLKRAVSHHQAWSWDGLLERLFAVWFRGLVYTQIWEDPQVDAAALQLDDTSRILTISSAGCNVLNYLTHDPERVLAVDVNAAHLALTRLRIAAVQHLPDHNAFFQFFGVGAGQENLESYHRHLRPHLRRSTRTFWESRAWGGLSRPRLQAFKDGFYKHGAFSRFRGLADCISTLIQNRSAEELLDATSREEQRQFFENCLAPFFDHPIVRRLARRPTALYSFGIPPRQYRSLQHAADGSIVDLYRDRLKRLVCGFPLSDNYFAWQAFGRRYDTEQREALPSYLQVDHFERLRNHLDCVETRTASLTDTLRNQPDRSFDSFVLLDAMDWMAPEAIATLWSELARAGTLGARVIFRTAGPDSPIESVLPPALRARFSYKRERAETLHTQDRSAVYGMFHLYVLTG